MQKFYLVWNEDRHALGIPSIDQQHRQLMDIVNKLSEAVSQGCDCMQAHLLIKKTLDFIKNHFAHEEKLMRQHGFPGQEQHEAEHGKLLEAALNLMDTLSPEHTDRAVLVTAFLTDCVEHHILHEDRAIGRYFEQMGIKAD